MKDLRCFEAADLPARGAVHPAVGAGEDELADLVSSTERYARRFAGPAGAWMLAVQLDAVRRLLRDRAPAAVLDVGAGHGQLTPPLARDGLHMTALVSSDAARGPLRDMPPGEDGPGSVRVAVGSLRAFPFPDRSFDAAISLRMMAHVQDWPLYLGELCRVSRDCVVVDFAAGGARGWIGQRLFGAKRRIEGDTRRFRVLGRAEIADVLARHGFVPDGTVHQFVLPMVLHRMLGRPRLSAALERLLSPLAGRIGNPVVLRAIRKDRT